MKPKAIFVLMFACVLLQATTRDVSAESVLAPQITCLENLELTLNDIGVTSVELPITGAVSVSKGALSDLPISWVSDTLTFTTAMPINYSLVVVASNAEGADTCNIHVSFPDVTTKSDTINGDIWTSAFSPYCIVGDISVEALTIQPGVDVLFFGDFAFDVTGSLNAMGAEADSIHFTVADSVSGWRGILFNAVGPGSELKYCTIENALNSGIRILNCSPAVENCLVTNNSAYSGGAFYIDRTASFDTLVIGNCQIVNNTSSNHGGGMLIWEAQGVVRLDSCTIDQNVSNPTKSASFGNVVGGGIYYDNYSDTGKLLLSNCSISSNSIYSECYSWGCDRTSRGGGLYLNGDTDLEDCKIDSNYCYSAEHGSAGLSEYGRSYGGGIYHQNGSVTITRCSISGNIAATSAADGYGYGGGIYIVTNSMKITNSLISCNTLSVGYARNHWAGGGIFVLGGSVDIENCTLAKNSHEAVYRSGGAVAVLNSIFYHNNGDTTQTAGTLSIEYSDIQNFDTTGTTNISVDPMFLGSGCTSDDFELSPGSPCIDAGHPFCLYNDVWFPPSQGFERNDLGYTGGPGARRGDGEIPTPLNPDLQVTSFEVPVDGWTGQAIDVEWTVSNLGDTATKGAWTEYVYLSTDTVVGNDTLVATFEFTEGLGVGESYTHVHPVPFPEDSPGEYWVIVHTNALDQVGECLYRDNNWRISDSSIIALLSPYADLIAGDVATIPNSRCGATIPVSWTVTNNGLGATDAPIWYDKVYLSEDAAFDANDLYLGSFQNFSYLAPGQTYPQSEREVTVPWKSAGQYYVIIRADATNVLNEHSAEDNNEAASVSLITIQDSIPPQPDLEVVLDYAQSNGWAGAPVEVDWTVTNLGNAPASGRWLLDWIMISEDSIPNSSDLHLGSYPSGYYTGNNLNPGDDYSRSVTTPNLPSYLDGTYYLFVWTDVRMEYDDFDWGNNFTPPVAISISPRPSPDIVVDTTVSFLPVTINSGDILSVTYTVVNNGPGVTPSQSWTDAVYLSEDDQLDLDQDVLLGSHVYYGNLTADEFYSDTITGAVPNNLGGDYYLFVYTDRYGSLNEGTWENNNATPADLLLNVTSTPPDLQVSELTPTTDTVWSGVATPVQWSVTNLGIGRTAAKDWQDNVYLSVDSFLSIGEDILVGEVDHSGALKPDSAYLVVADVAVPQGSEGDYYLIVVCDANDMVYEDTAENNNTRSNVIPIVLTPPPDIRIDTFELAGTAWSGQAVQVDWTIGNHGEGPTVENEWRDRIYLSSDETLDTLGDVLLLDTTHFESLPPAGSYTASASVMLPNGDLGSQHLFVLADAADDVYEHLFESNNTDSIAISITFTPPPDLQISEIVAPDTLRAGLESTVQWSITNGGTGGTMGGSWVDRVYLSANATSDTTGDDLLFSLTHNGVLSEGQNYTINRDVPIPEGISGSLYLKILTDADNIIYENDADSNNISALTVEVVTPDWDYLKTPNLVVSDVTVADTIVAGDSIIVDWTVTNARPFATPSSGTYWHDGIYLSTDMVLDTATDTLLGQFAHFGTMDAESGYNRTESVICPDAISGPRFILVAADIYNLITETSAVDNVDGDSATISLQPPDLVVTVVTASDSADAGQTISVDWTVLNNGIGATKVASWYDRVYLSKDQILDGTDVDLGFYNNVNPLDVDSVYSASQTFNVPPGLAGPYYVIVKTDKNDNVYEPGGEGNNYTRTLDASQIVLPAPVNLVVTAITVPDSAIAGEPTTISWTVTNDSANVVTGDWTDAVYLSADSIWNYTDPLVGTAELTSVMMSGGSYTKSISVDVAGAFEGDLESNTPGVVPGDYHVIVRTDIRNNINEVDEGDNGLASASQVAVDVTELTYDVQYDLQASLDTPQYYRIEVDDNYDIALDLSVIDPGARLRLHVGYGFVPSRMSYDHAYYLGDDSSVIIPSSDSGVVYLMVRSEQAVIPIAYSLSATSIPFSVFSLSPNVIGNDGHVTVTVFGAVFDDSVQVKLVGVDTIAPLVSGAVHSGLIVSDFLFEQASVGDYSLELVKGGEDTILLPLAVALVPADIPDLDYSINMPGAYRLGANDLVFECTVNNLSNVNCQYVELTWVTNDTKSVIEIVDSWLPLTSVDGEVLRNTVVSDSMLSRREMLIALPPYSTEHFTLKISNVSVAELAIGFSASCLDEDALVAEYQQEALELRYFIVNSALFSALTPGEQELIIDENDWLLFYSEVLYQLNQLATPLGEFQEDVVQGISRDKLTVGTAKLSSTSTSALGLNPVLCDLMIEDWRNLHCMAIDQLGMQLETIEWLRCFNDIVGMTINPKTKLKGLLLYLKTRAGLINNVNAVLSCVETAFGANSRIANLIRTYDECIRESRLRGQNCCASWCREEFDVPPCMNEEDLQKMMFEKYWETNDDDFRRNINSCMECLIGANCSYGVGSRDPNEKHGPTGMDGPNIVSLGQTLPYTVYFENMAEATAPAIDVSVTDQLDTLFDWRKFRLSEIAWGDTTIVVPGNPSYWHGTVNLDSLGLLLEIDAGINGNTGEAHWYFNTIDPATGQPPTDPFAGFLPPNDSSGRGEGHVSFTIKADGDLSEGTEIKNEAMIVFDINDPIMTNEVVNVIYHALPDLIVSSAGMASDSAQLYSEVASSFNATIENVGPSDVESTFYAKLFLATEDSSRNMLDSAEVSGLLSGQSTPVNFVWVPDSGIVNSQLHFWADFDNTIVEYDETNNSRAIPVEVLQGNCGNVENANSLVDIGDITVLINHLFITLNPLPVRAAGDLDCSGLVDIGDLTLLIQDLFISLRDDHCWSCAPTPDSTEFQSNGSSGTCNLRIQRDDRKRYQLTIEGDLETTLAGFQQEYRYDANVIVIDSIIAGPANEDVPVYYSARGGKISLGMVHPEGKQFIAKGKSILATIYFHPIGTRKVENSSLNHVMTKAVDSHSRTVALAVNTGDLQLRLPDSYALSQNFPNPFNTTTVIQYALPKQSDVKIKVFNILGQTVRTVLDLTQPAGYYEVTWDGKNRDGEVVSSGVYFYHIEAGSFTQSKKMMLLK